ncbi:MAG: hypothetical protein JWO37_602 [Acidimicrobiales bacterium]|nr:hypothetical protein [Acidimicrobiales bacterium]
MPAVEGWFAMAGEPQLLGTRCTSCGTFFFPPSDGFCRNPECQGTEFEPAPLSRRGTVWSYTDNRYQPPPPYMSPDPFEPYTIAAVELAGEGLVVLGQMVAGELVAIGDEVEVVLDTLFEDDSNEYVMWKWKKVGA